MDIVAIQKALGEERIDGWLLYDFRGTNPIARSVIGFDESQIGTRRWFYLVPREGEPVAILHAIEPHALRGAPGRSVLYRSWKDLESLLKTHLSGMKRVAMEYSPGAAIPYVGRVDAGTIEMVRAAGPEVVSSADLVQVFEARWTPEQKALHDRAARDTLLAKDEAFALIKDRLASGQPVKESEVQAFIQARFEARGLTTHHPCIVAVNEHASDPQRCDDGPKLPVDLRQGAGQMSGHLLLVEGPARRGHVGVIDGQIRRPGGHERQIGFIGNQQHGPQSKRGVHMRRGGDQHIVQTRSPGKAA